jgi:hypothetical protein
MGGRVTCLCVCPLSQVLITIRRFLQSEEDRNIQAVLGCISKGNPIPRDSDLLLTRAQKDWVKTRLLYGTVVCVQYSIVFCFYTKKILQKEIIIL